MERTKFEEIFLFLLVPFAVIGMLTIVASLAGLIALLLSPFIGG